MYRMKEEAIAHEKSNHLSPCLFLLQSVISRKKLVALKCSLLMFCKFHVRHKKQIGMASWKRGETLKSREQSDSRCEEDWLNLV